MTNTIGWSVAVNMSADSQSIIVARHIGQRVDQESAEMIDLESANMLTNMENESQLTYQLTCQSSIGR